MIIVRRGCGSSSSRKHLMSISTLSPIMSSPVQPSSTLSPSSTTTTATSVTSSSSCGGGQSQSFDWNNALSPDNKSRTIQLLTLDRENFKQEGWFGDGDGTIKKKEGSPKITKTAAVLVPLCLDVQGNPSILYNLRSFNLSRHKGEISFPGGTVDPEDNGDAVTAALRETHEELGITGDLIDIWTTLRPFPTVSSNMVVTAVLASIKEAVDPTKLNICPEEVDHAFLVTLEHLCDPSNWGEGPERSFKGMTYRLPIWKNLNVFNNGNGEEIPLWGLTAFVTHIALSAILPQSVYRRKLPLWNLILKPPTTDKKEDNKSSSNL